MLLVGAGGIGCELLKNLVLTGYGEIHVIDLDTIDLSNLNRQFLFRHEHIKKPKATVAKEVAQKFNPSVKITSYHANIKDAQFNIDWFSSFALIFNALDNIDARRHVNKMCLAADVPLIESGTTGYRGHVQVIKKGKTACYDCSEKQLPTTFPVCTIRSTPSQPIHCIVWAKSYLLPELFGTSEDDVPELDTAADSENAEEIQKLREEAQALKTIRESMGQDDFPRKVFDKVFGLDIERLRGMEDMWKSRKPPTPLSYDDLSNQSANIPASVCSVDQTVWTIPETVKAFEDSLSRLSNRIKSEASTNPTSEPIITFDKDDDDTLDFVTATANLRANIFGIQQKSKFDTKQMAGNIIPAIATTNAMIAGLCVLQGFKVMKEEYGRTRMIFVDRGNMVAQPSDPPNPECGVCSLAMLRVKVDFERATLKDLVENVLKQELGYGEEMTLLSEAGLVYDPDLEDNLEKKLTDLNIKKGQFMIVKDDEDEPGEGEQGVRVDLQIAIEAQQQGGGEGVEKPTGTHESSAVLLVREEGGNSITIPRKPKKKPEASNEQDLDDEVIGAVTNGDGVGKRKRSADDDIEIMENGAPASKMGKTVDKGKGKAASNGQTDSI